MTSTPHITDIRRVDMFTEVLFRGSVAAYFIHRNVGGQEWITDFWLYRGPTKVFECFLPPGRPPTNIGAESQSDKERAVLYWHAAYTRAAEILAAGTSHRSRCQDLWAPLVNTLRHLDSLEEMVSNPR